MTEEPEKQQILQTLIDARNNLNMTQKELSKAAGLTQSNISAIEHGKRPLTLKTTKLLAKALNIDYKILL